MEIFLEYIDKVGLIGIIVAVTAFLVGMKFPDWDFKMKLQHRSILTHSPLFLFLIFFQKGGAEGHFFIFR